MALIDRFTGAGSEAVLLDCLRNAKLVQGDKGIANELIAGGQVIGFDAGAVLIEQDGEDTDIYLLIAGECDIVINGRIVARRGPGDHVGEMAAIEPRQRRSATVAAAKETVAIKLTEPAFRAVATRYPEIYRDIARELSRRLLQRNALIGVYREKIRLFIISSAEALPMARELQNAFEHDPFNVILWTDGVFKATSYTLQNLEDEVDRSDFAIAIAHADDQVVVRGQDWPAPRDNVIFELGLFMGRLGRERAILMEPREDAVKLPSDLAGVTTIPYRFKQGQDAAASLGPASNRLRDHINRLGPNNG